MFDLLKKENENTSKCSHFPSARIDTTLLNPDEKKGNSFHTLETFLVVCHVLGQLIPFVIKSFRMGRNMLFFSLLGTENVSIWAQKKLALKIKTATKPKTGCNTNEF